MTYRTTARCHRTAPLSRNGCVRVFACTLPHVDRSNLGRDAVGQSGSRHVENLSER